MAGANVNSIPVSHTGGSARATTVEYNKMVDDIEKIRAGLAALALAYNATLAKLDADAGVTDVNYAATNPAVNATYDNANDLAAGKIADTGGVVIV